MRDVRRCDVCKEEVFHAVIASGKRVLFDAAPNVYGEWKITDKEKAAPWADKRPDRELFDESDDGWRYTLHPCKPKRRIR